MQRMEFGYSNDKNPTGSWEGIGLKHGLMLTEADYFGAVKMDGDQFVVVKVTEDEYNRYPELLGKFMVIPAIADLYPDGSGNIFLSQEGNDVSEQLQTYLNRSAYKDTFTSVDDFIGAISGLSRADRSFDFLTNPNYNEGNIVVTSILPAAFEKKKNAINHCQGSFSSLSQQIMDMHMDMDMDYSRTH